MPTLAADDGVKLHYEEAGSGTPLLFVHEFAGDHRSWESQLRHFSRRYRCIAYNARGYPPSDVPEEFERYSQEWARDDARAVLDRLGIDKAHVVGLSMGAFATLHFGLAYPERALSITTAGVGSGAVRVVGSVKRQYSSRRTGRPMVWSRDRAFWRAARIQAPPWGSENAEHCRSGFKLPRRVYGPETDFRPRTRR